MTTEMKFQLVFAVFIVLSVFALMIQNRRLNRIILSSENSQVQTRKDFDEHLANVKLHLKRHEEILRTIENDRLSPMAKNIIQLHKDQENLLIYASKIFSDTNFGTTFTKERKTK